MSAVLSRASGVIEEGKRLENLSWRLWCHESLYCSRPRRTHPSAHRLAQRKLKLGGKDVTKIPHLSSSLDSLDCSTDSETDGQATPVPTPQTCESGSVGTIIDTQKHKNKRRDNHITPGHLSQLVTCIKEKKDLIGPLSHSEVCLHDTFHHEEPQHNASQSPDNTRTPRASSPRPILTEPLTPAVEPSSDSVTSQASYATTSSEASSHAVVHGFQIGGAGRSSYKSQSQLHTAPQPILKNSNTAKSVGPRKKAGFQLGSSSDEDSVRESAPLRTQSFPKALQAKKQTSFKEDVEEIEPERAASKQPKFHLGHEDEDDEDGDYSDVFESDDDLSEDDDEVSESAIEDDEDGWEDDPEERDEPRELNFHRVDSRPNLVSRRSLLTERVHEGQRAAALEEAAMAATPPQLRRSRMDFNGPLVPTSPEERMSRSASAIGPGQSTMSSATNIPAPRALSPRTNRRNMLANELGTSLRKHLLWERQQRNPIPAAPSAIPRRHTTHDLQNTNQYLEAGGTDAAPNLHLGPGTRNNSWNDYFDNGLGEYHQKGW